MKYKRKIAVLIIGIVVAALTFGGCSGSSTSNTESSKSDETGNDQKGKLFSGKNTITYVSHVEEENEDENGEISTAVYDCEEIVYDEEENQYVATCSSEDGTIAVYTYDADGNLKEKQFTNGDTVSLMRYTDNNGSCDRWSGDYWYREFRNADGDIVGSSTCTLSDGEVNSRIIWPYLYFYDTKGERAGYIDLAERSGITKCTYDDDGKLIQTENDELNTLVKYEYDKNGEVIYSEYDSLNDGAVTRTTEEYEYDKNGNLLKSEYTVYNSEGGIFVRDKVQYEYETVKKEKTSANSKSDENAYQSFDSAVEGVMELTYHGDIDALVALLPEDLSDEWLEILCISEGEIRENYKELLTEYFQTEGYWRIATTEELKEELERIYSEYLEGEELEDALSDAAMEAAIANVSETMNVYDYLYPSSEDIYHTGLWESLSEDDSIEYDGYELMGTVFYSRQLKDDIYVVVLHDVDSDLYYPVLQLDF